MNSNQNHVYMKTLKEIFQGFLGLVALLATGLVAFGRLTWRKMREWWGRRSKTVRRLVVGAVALLAFAYVGTTVGSELMYRYGRCRYCDEEVSENVTKRYFRDGKYRLYNNETGEYTIPKVNWVSPPSDGDSLSVYACDGRRGYINVNTGEIVIDAKDHDFAKAWVFSEGLAAVQKDDRIGFMNSDGEMVLDFVFESTEKCRQWDFSGYVFHDGVCLMTEQEGHVGLIDANGNWLLEPVYDEIWEPSHGGYRKLTKGDLSGVLDPSFNIIIPVEYDYVGMSDRGLTLAKDGRQWLQDMEGNVLNPFLYDSSQWLSYPIGYDAEGEIENAFSMYAKYEICGAYGILNRITGKPLTLAVYESVYMLSEGVFEVRDEDAYESYLVNAYGNKI